MKTKNFIELTAAVVIVLFLFVFVSYLQKEINFEGILKDTLIGIFIYLLLVVSSVVFAPVTFIPLIPVASSIFGASHTAIYTVIGWSLGSLIAFSIAQDYGKPVVKKFASLKKIEEIQELVPGEAIFLNIVLLKIFFPIDLLNYALGVLTKMKKLNFFLASILSSIPFAFFFSFAGELDILQQIIIFIFGGGIFILFSYLYLRRCIRNKSCIGQTDR